MDRGQAERRRARALARASLGVRRDRAELCELSRARARRSGRLGATAGAGHPDCDALVAASHALAGAAPDVIAIECRSRADRSPRRRAADNAITSAYVARGLGAHTPSETRPGPIADAMRVGFGAHDYRSRPPRRSRARRAR